MAGGGGGRRWRAQGAARSAAQVYAASFSPDGKFLALGSDDKTQTACILAAPETVTLVDTVFWRPVGKLKQGSLHTRNIDAVRFALAAAGGERRRRRMLVTAGDDAAAVVLSAE